MNNHNSSSQTINNAGAYADNIENQNLKETMNPTKSPLIDYYLSLIHI